MSYDIKPAGLDLLVMDLIVILKAHG